MDRRQQLHEAGRWLRKTRELSGMSVREFATAVGVATQAVYNWESGKNGVDDERAELIADTFNTDLIETRRNLGLWVPDLPAPEDEPTDQEIRDSALQPETKAALLEMRQTIREWERRRDKAAIQRASRVIKALDEGNEGQTG